MSEERRLKISRWLRELDPDDELTADELHILRDALALRRQSGRAWAVELAIKPQGEGPNAPPPDTDRPILLDEAVASLLVSVNDRAVETLTAMQDIQMRLTRLEVYIAATVPGYDAGVANIVNRMIAERSE